MLDSGSIWNTDYVDLKDRLGRRFEKEVDAIKDVLLNSGDGLGPCRTSNKEYPGINELYSLLPFGLYNLPSLAKSFKKMTAKTPAKIEMAVAQLIADWTPTWDMLFKEAKPLIVKGRKPSDTPSKTPPRTLESTGTCPVCGRNIKIDENRKMVNHGYEVQYHSFQGGCFGVGYKAWEVSSEGAIAFQKAVQIQKRLAEESIPKINALEEVNVGTRRFNNFRTIRKGEAGFDSVIARRIEEKNQEIAYLCDLIERLDEKIASWTPQALPGLLAGFDR